MNQIAQYKCGALVVSDLIRLVEMRGTHFIASFDYFFMPFKSNNPFLAGQKFSINHEAGFYLSKCHFLTTLAMQLFVCNLGVSDLCAMMLPKSEIIIESDEFCTNTDCCEQGKRL